jgi:hypothetical protein
MDKKIIFDYDRERNILFAEDHWDVKTNEDVDEFFDEYVQCFQKLGRKVYVVVNIDNLLVHGSVQVYYGESSLRTVNQYVIGLARWGVNDKARMTVRTTSLKVKLAPNIYKTREEAVKAIEDMKREEEGEGEKGEGEKGEGEKEEGENG